MFNSTLQWHDGKKEWPRVAGRYAVVICGFQEIVVVDYDGTALYTADDFQVYYDTSIEYWADAPTAKTVRDKFKLGRLRR
jgi:hypothetical protein